MYLVGGALASLLGVTYGVPVVTFESPGEKLAAKRLHLPSPVRQPDFSPFLSTFNSHSHRRSTSHMSIILLTLSPWAYVQGYCHHVA